VQPFLPYALDDAEYLDKDATGDQIMQYSDISRASEGHLEMIEMGTLVDEKVANSKWVDVENYPICDPESTAGVGNPIDLCPGIARNWTTAELAQPETLTPYGSASAATHGADGHPDDCQQLVDAWTYGADPEDDGYWITTEGAADVEAPSGGLFGGAAIVNVTAGTMYSYDAKAIDGFADNVDAADFLHAEPGTILPSLDSGDRTDAHVFIDGSTTSDDLARGVDAVSYVFMHDQIMNEYTTESAVGAATEWVMTFPTKQFYVHQAFLDDYEVNFRSGNANNAEQAPVDPFTSTWTWVYTTYQLNDDETAYVVDEPGYVDYPCELVQLDTIWDREEQIYDPETPPGEPVPPIVSPAPPPPEGGDTGATPFELCYETSVIAFGQDSDQAMTSILGSRNFHTVDNSNVGETGWARLNFLTGWNDANEDGNIDNGELFPREPLGNYPDGLRGLPVTGFAVERFQNAFLGDGADVLANYGGIFQHKATRKIASRGDYHQD
jgi:hypothetical protein